MSGLMVCPECPECGSRKQQVRFDTDEHVGVVTCPECGEHIMVVSVLANKQLRTVKDPMAGELPDEVFEDLAEENRLPPVYMDGGSNE